MRAWSILRCGCGARRATRSQPFASSPRGASPIVMPRAVNTAQRSPLGSRSPSPSSAETRSLPSSLRTPPSTQTDWFWVNAADSRRRWPGLDKRHAGCFDTRRFPASSSLPVLSATLTAGVRFSWRYATRRTARRQRSWPGRWLSVRNVAWQRVTSPTAKSGRQPSSRGSTPRPIWQTHSATPCADTFQRGCCSSHGRSSPA